MRVLARAAAPAAVLAYRPPAFPRELVPLVVPVLGRRPADPLEAAGWQLRWRLGPPTPAPAGALPLALRISGEPAVAFLPPILVRAVTGDLPLDPGRPELAAMVLEAALAPWLDAAERVGLPSVGCETVGPTAPGEGWFRCQLRVEPERGAPPAVVPLALSPGATRVLARAAVAWEPAGAGPDPVIAAAARLAVTRLALAELRGLEPGDAFVLPGGVAGFDRLALVAAEALAAPAALAGQRLRLEGPLRRLDRQGKEEWTMDDTREERPLEAALAPLQRDGADSFDDLSVRVAFEVGRLELTVGQLRGLAEGQVLDLARAPEGAVEIRAGGRTLGRGELVDLGGVLGVRITRLGYDA